MKNLFIPLKKEYFLQFESGSKSIEYRSYGQRWNEKTCTKGRRVTLSLGYSGRRLSGTLSKLVVSHVNECPPEARIIYPDAELIACLHITIDI